LIRESVKRVRQILLDCVPLTGMRLEEMIRLGKDEDRLSGTSIHLPVWA